MVREQFEQELVKRCEQLGSLITRNSAHIYVVNAFRDLGGGYNMKESITWKIDLREKGPLAHVLEICLKIKRGEAEKCRLQELGRFSTKSQG